MKTDPKRTAWVKWLRAKTSTVFLGLLASAGMARAAGPDLPFLSSGTTTFAPTVDLTLNTDAASDVRTMGSSLLGYPLEVAVFDYASIEVPVGVTVTVRGSLPAVFVAQTMTIGGVFDASGVAGIAGGQGPAGFQGGAGGGGGGGGGALAFFATSSFTLASSGKILAQGGAGGAGGLPGNELTGSTGFGGNGGVAGAGGSSGAAGAASGTGGAGGAGAASTGGGGSGGGGGGGALGGKGGAGGTAGYAGNKGNDQKVGRAGAAGGTGGALGVPLVSAGGTGGDGGEANDNSQAGDAAKRAGKAGSPGIGLGDWLLLGNPGGGGGGGGGDLLTKAGAPVVGAGGGPGGAGGLGTGGAGGAAGTPPPPAPVPKAPAAPGGMGLGGPGGGGGGGAIVLGASGGAAFSILGEVSVLGASDAFDGVITAFAESAISGDLRGRSTWDPLGTSDPQNFRLWGGTGGGGGGSGGGIAVVPEPRETGVLVAVLLCSVAVARRLGRAR